MNDKKRSISNKMYIFWLVICGIFAGFINGLLGTGGGIVLVFALNKLLKEKNKDSQSRQKNIFATTLCVTLALSVVSIIVYCIKGSFSKTENIWIYVASAGLGGVIGGVLLDKLKTKYVRIIFAVLLLFAGLNMSGIIGG